MKTTALLSLLSAAVLPAAAFEVASLQSSIDAASAAGGGVVSVPAGTWEAGPLRLRSGVTLRLEKGAVLRGPTDPAPYRSASPRFGAFVQADGEKDVAIEGEGVLDGRGGFFPTAGWRPKLVLFTDCRNVRVEGVTLRSSGSWTMFCDRCDGVVYRRVKLFSHDNHCTDGLDVSSRNVLIEDCDIDADDDALVFKTLSPEVVVENVVVRNCRFASSCNAIKIGTESHGRVRNIDIRNVALAPTGAQGRFDWRTRIPGAAGYHTGLAGIAVECVDGGTLENVSVRDVKMTGYQTPVFVRLGRRTKAADGHESFLRGVLVENVKAVAASRVACSITGVPGLRPRDVTLRNVAVLFPGGGGDFDTLLPVPEVEASYPENFMFNAAALPAYGFYVRHADGVRFENVRTRLSSPDRRPAVFIDDADVSVDAASSFAPTSGRLANVCRARAEELAASVDAFWKGLERGDALFAPAPGRADGAKPPLLVLLGFRRGDRPEQALGVCRGRGWSMLLPFARDAAGVLKAVESVKDRVDARRILLKGDGSQASLALELAAQKPALWAGVAAVSPAKAVDGLSAARGLPVDIVAPARNPAKARAGLEAFNALAAAPDRIEASVVEGIVTTGKVPGALRYGGRDPGFLPPSRPLLLRRQSGEVRLSLTDNAEVGCFIPSLEWLAGLGPRAVPGAKRRLVFAGDSTLQRRGADDPAGSWGEALRPYLADDVEVVNCAIGGRSTRTYMGDWVSNTLEKVRAGDWVLIQFGHNDSSKSSDPRIDRMTDPDSEYVNNLRRFVADVKLKGGRPLLVTPISLFLYRKDGSWAEKNPLGPWVAAMKRYAADYEIPVVDLNALSTAALRAAGRDTAATWFMYSVDGKDWAHPTRLGAESIARLFVDEVLAKGGPVAGLFRPGAGGDFAVVDIAADGRLLESRGASVAGIAVGRDENDQAFVRFTYRPERDGAALRLRVRGLHPRNWIVSVDGWSVGKWLDEELDAGVSLGVQPAGPVEVSKKGVQRPSDWEKWRPLLRNVKSTFDGTLQNCYFYAPDKAATEPVPLVVGLHTWSGDWRNAGHYAPALDYARAHGWAMVGPDFRGPNDHPLGCGGEAAVQDVVDAVEYAKAHAKIDPKRIYIVGGSGGGHMTLLMAGRHPEIWAGCAAFCPITDVARWHADSLLDHPGRGRHYARMLERACGGTPAERPAEYAARSPLAWLARAKAAKVPVYIVTGIHDGWTGSVPVGHSFRAFNALAAPGDAVSEEDIAAIEATQRVPDALAWRGEADPFYGDKMKIHFRRTSGNVRFTLFEGGHGGNFAAGLDFLSRQVKGRPADMSLPERADGSEVSLGK